MCVRTVFLIRRLHICFTSHKICTGEADVSIKTALQRSEVLICLTSMDLLAWYTFGIWTCGTVSCITIDQSSQRRVKVSYAYQKVLH